MNKKSKIELYEEILESHGYADVVFVTLNVTAVNQRDVGDRLVLEEGIVEVFC